MKRMIKQLCIITRNPDQEMKQKEQKVHQDAKH